MNWSHKPLKCILTGKSGNGKTTLFIDMVKAAMQGFEHVIIFDHEGEFSQRLNVKPVKNLPEAKARLKAGGLVLFDSVGLLGGDKIRGFDWICNWIYAIATAASRAGINHKYLICCDEIQLFMTPNHIPPILKLIVETGRRYGIDLLAIGNQLNRINNTFRQNLTHAISFQILDKNSKKFFIDEEVLVE